MADEIQKTTGPTTEEQDMNIDDIKTAVQSEFEISSVDIEGDSRKREHVVPRMVALYLSRKLTELSYLDIGRAFNRDHASILNGVSRIDELVKSDLLFYDKVSGIIRKIKDGGRATFHRHGSLSKKPPHVISDKVFDMIRYLRG